jgi:hypothetical protein
VNVDNKADLIDQANEAAELFTRAALSQRAPEGPAATGHCFNCDALLAAGLRWCDQHCREDWSKRQRADALRQADAE